MSSQKLIWTALPNGIDDRGLTLKLSVYVSPQLVPGPSDPWSLQNFPDWWDWPAAAPKFQVVLDLPGGPLTLDAVLDPASKPASSDYWKALFSPDTPVRPYAYKRLDDRQIRSYHILGIHDYLKDTYKSIAIDNASDFPSSSDLSGLLGVIRDRGKRDDELRQTILQEKVPPAGEPFNVRKDFMRFQLFHTPPSLNQMPLTVPKMDFHDMVGAMARYPLLMREMGLVFDLLVRKGDRVLPATGRVKVVPTWKPGIADSKDSTPWTHYAMGDAQHPTEFRAQPKVVQEYTHAKLPLADNPLYGVIQMEVDGMAFKSIALARDMSHLAASPFIIPRAAQGPVPSEQDPPLSLPAAATAGLTLARNYRAATLLDRLVAATQHNTDLNNGQANNMDLYLEDVVRGHRLDVYDESTARWYSLHERVGTYTLGDYGDITRTDEGWTMTSAAGPADPSVPQDLRVPETLAEWSGWSLSAPPPWSVIGPKDEIQDKPEQADSNFKLVTTFKAQKLPRLRFGRKYRLLARSVDLAGNGPKLEDDKADPGAISSAVTYRRYEPVVQPVLIPHDPYKDSESIEHLVVRTWTTPPHNTPVSEPTERHVAPPVTTVRMAETFGSLDDPSSPTGIRTDAYTLLTGLEGDPPPDRVPVPDDQWTLNYLPDPAAHGASFTGLPGAGGAKLVAFDGNPWPKYQPFRIHVESGSGAPTWSSADRVLKVSIPPAMVARVRLSSYPAQPELEGKMGVWQWVMENYNPGDPESPPVGNSSYDQILQTALEGRHWMVTPYREIQLIHAVQQPLVPPKWITMGASRPYGATYADIRYLTPCNGNSTQKLDVSAKWTQWIDDVTQPKPEQVDGNAHAFTKSVDPGITELEALNRHEFGDTKHRWVDYTGTMLTRFPEFFPPGTTPLERTTQETGGPFHLNVPSSARPEVPRVLYVLPLFEWVPAQPGPGGQQSMTRRGNAVRVYLDRPWYSSGDEEKLGVILNLRPPLGAVWPIDYAREVHWKYESNWGQDPAVTSGPVPDTLTADRFSLAGDAVDMLTLAEVPNGYVTVSPHEVAYDENQGLWYCDIRIEPDAGSTAYWPFVRLALARYQPNSIQGAHLSRIARADFVQLPTDRSVSVAPGRTAGDYNVSLFGLHAHIKDGAAPWRRVEVTVESKNGDGLDFGWTPVGQPVPLSAFLIPNLYQGTVHVAMGDGSVRYRLVFKEYEKLIADPLDRNLSGSGTLQEVWRVIFAHAFEL